MGMYISSVIAMGCNHMRLGIFTTRVTQILLCWMFLNNQFVIVKSTVFRIRNDRCFFIHERLL